MSGDKTEVTTGKKKHGRTLRFLMASVSIIVITVIAALLGSAVFHEWRRARLLDSYAANAKLLSVLREPGTVGLQALSQPGESVVCAIDSYGRVENLPLLTAAQKRSLPKDHLPSEDGAWYLLFFSPTSVERVVAIRGIPAQGLLLDASLCTSVRSSFSVTRRLSTAGESEFIFSLSKGH